MLHFACNAFFRGTIREEFKAHVAVISSGHPRDLDTSVHNITQENGAESWVVRSQGVVFFPANIACVVLELWAD